jgi:hypothetical protein
MDKKQSALDMKTESDGDEYDKVAEQSDQDDDAEGASNLEDGTAADNHRGVYPDHESHVVTWSLVRFTQMAVMHKMWWYMMMIGLLMMRSQQLNPWKLLVKCMMLKKT